MVDGILDLRLVPRWSPSSVRSDLMAALSRAHALQAGIGFWTIPDALLGPDLARTLRAKDGFVCVDLHVPTEVALAALAAQGAHVRVYHEDIPTYTATGRKEPPALLHSKMLLFWSADHTVELWVGSHNWTHRAILGLNVEASIVVRLRDSSPLFRAAARYLAKIKKIAEPFDPAKVDVYKEVQRRSLPPLGPVIELEARDAGRFAGHRNHFWNEHEGTEPARYHPAPGACRAVRPQVRCRVCGLRGDSPLRPPGGVGCRSRWVVLLAAPICIQKRAEVDVDRIGAAN